MLGHFPFPWHGVLQQQAGKSAYMLGVEGRIQQSRRALQEVPARGVTAALHVCVTSLWQSILYDTKQLVALCLVSLGTCPDCCIQP